MAVTDAMVEAAAQRIADSPGIDAPKLPAPCWYGLARKVLEAAEQAAWRPISEAPKDRTEVLAYRRYGRYYMTFRLLFVPQDLWVGVFWKTYRKMGTKRLRLYICVLPMVPIEVDMGVGKPNFE